MAAVTPFSFGGREVDPRDQRGPSRQRGGGGGGRPGPERVKIKEWVVLSWAGEGVAPFFDDLFFWVFFGFPSGDQVEIMVVLDGEVGRR